MAYRYSKTVSIDDSNILSRKSKGLSYEYIKPLSTSNKMSGTKARVKFNDDYLNQEKI